MGTCRDDGQGLPAFLSDRRDFVAAKGGAVTKSSRWPVCDLWCARRRAATVEPLPFVGRGAVLGELGAALTAARAGRGGLVVLTGTAGAGVRRRGRCCSAGPDACPSGR